jgi:ABC transporter DrrB family efflux protein
MSPEHQMTVASPADRSESPELGRGGPAIRVEGVAKRFGETQALAGVDLEVPEGAVFGLLGPNGAGKTTLVRILSTLVPPDSGRAEILGHDVAQEPAAIRELIALTGQFAAVDELLTGRENLEMFGRLFDLSREEAAARADRLLRDFDLADAADRPARTYSGGMRRRLDLCSSLLTQPRILFLDEPTTGLDPRSRNQIWAAIRELQRGGTTLLLTTQYLEEADQLAERIAVIDNGRVIAAGTGNELKDQVGGQILEVELADASQRELAQETLTRLIEDAAAELRREGIRVSDLGLRRPTLDDVFLQLTGAPPGEDGDRPARAAVDGAGALHVGRPQLRVPSLESMRGTVKDVVVVTVRNLRHFIREPGLLLFSTIQPVMFVLLFVYVFGGAIEGSLPTGVPYVDFLLPGIFVQSVVFRATQTSVGLSQDLQRGVIDRFRSMPMARSAVLIGRTAADLVRNVLIIILMIVVGYIVGFRFEGGLGGALGCIAVVALFGLALSWIFAFVALTVRGAEAAQSAGFVVTFPLVFASSIFVPLDTLPGWLEAIAKVSPVTLTTDAARSLALTGTPESLGGALAWTFGLLAVFVPLCVWRYRRMS